MKKVLSVALALVFTLSFCACGQTGSPSEQSTPDVQATEEPVSAFPEASITLINTSDAGSASDLIARAAAQMVSENCGATIVVDDRPGGSGAVGCGAAASSANDGYTILLSVYGHALLTAALNDVGYTNDSFTHICMLASAPFTFCVRPDTYGSYEEMVDAFLSGETINIGVPGATSGPAIYLSQFKEELGIGDNLQIIPYDSGSAASAALLGGDLDVTCLPCAETMKYHVAEELKVLLVCGDTPHTLDTEIPTAADVGLSCRGEMWYAISAPAGLDESIVSFYEEQFKLAYDSELLQETFSNIGAIPAWMGHEDFTEYCANQWAQLIDVA